VKGGGETGGMTAAWLIRTLCHDFRGILSGCLKNIKHKESASCEIPFRLLEASGHDFSRAERTTKLCGALAPAAFVFSHLQPRSD
jgi:hypothetical protein